MSAPSNKAKGDRFEATVAHALEDLGEICFRVRQGQGEPVDLVSISPGGSVRFVQVKSGKRGPYLLPAEREGLVEKAKACRATAWVAWKDGTVRMKAL